MKFSRYLVLLMAVALILPLAVFAREKNQGKLVLEQPVLVGATHLLPGTYQVEWTGNGQSLTVNILQHRQVVATAQGELKSGGAAQDAVVLMPSNVNSSQMMLSEIDFGGRHEALLLTPNGLNSSNQMQ
jgi:hypothetical protein